MKNKWKLPAVILLTAAIIITISSKTGPGKLKNTALPETLQQIQYKSPRIPVTLTVEVFDRSNAPEGAGTADSNYMTRLIQDVWGTPNNVVIRYVPVPRSLERDRLIQLMASGSAPDIIFTYSKDLYLQFAKQGYLSDLTDYINETKNLKAMAEKNKNDLLYNGRYLAVAAYRSMIERHLSFIRTDWLYKLGMEAPTTTDEWYAVMRAFKKSSLGGEGEKTIPFGMRATSYIDNHFGAQHLLWSFVRATDEELQTLPYLLLPGFKDGVQFINRLYNEGLIDPTFDLDEDERSFKSNLVNGKIGFVTMDTVVLYDQKNGYLLENLQKNIPEAQFEPIECFKNANGKYLKSVYPNYGWFVMVPSATTPERLQAAIDFLDWQSSHEGLKLIKWGESDRHYTLKDGIPTVNDSQMALNKKERFNADDLSLMWNGNYNINRNLLFKQIEISDPKWGKEKVIAMKMAMHDGFRDYNANPVFDTTIAASGRSLVNLEKLYLDGLAKVIKSRPSDFENNYSKLVSDFLANGGQEILNQKSAAYRARGN